LQARPLFFIAPTAAATGTARNTYVNVSLRAYRLRAALLAVRGLRGREASGSFPVDRPDALVSFEELHEIMGMHEVEELERRFLTPEQLEAKYGSGRKAKIMPDAKPAPKKQTA